MTVEQQPAKRTGMNSSHPKAENEETIGDKVVTSYGEGAAEEAGKKTVDYVADPESRAQEHIDNVKGWWAKTFPCCAST
ncbi:hypothetical protein BDZ89DRAFT_1062415, partial [Hymenopellis radicata]